MSEDSKQQDTVLAQRAPWTVMLRLASVKARCVPPWSAALTIDKTISMMHQGTSQLCCVPRTTLKPCRTIAFCSDLYHFLHVS